MNGKRVTIYDLAKELGISASYISRALNDHPSISEKVKKEVKEKAKELNYKYNSQAANLRRGSSRTLGVIVPKINENFFSEAIAGIEEACFEQNYSLIICQSHESYQQECKAINTLIHQNVDCILISISAETTTSSCLEEIQANNIELVQFDRCLGSVNSFKVINDNKDAALHGVRHLIQQGYKRIAFLGGPDDLTIFKDRKEGYLHAIKEAGLNIPYDYVLDNCLSKTDTIKAARELLNSKEPPDAFFTVADLQSVSILQVANELQVTVPDQLGILGFANETFTELIKPTLSSIDQKSKEIGKCAANLYFEHMLQGRTATKETYKNKIIKSEIIVRESSCRSLIYKRKPLQDSRKPGQSR